MHCIRTVCEDTVWIGGNDRRLAKFENLFPIPRGVSYNSYLVNDEKTVLLDTVDNAISRQFFDNLTVALQGKPLDYVIISHMEPDHCGTLEEVVRRWPNVKVVGNAKTFTIIKQFYTFGIQNELLVKEGDTLCTGKHVFTFFMAPMVHWPEVMVEYDATTKTLFTADAFGTFGALDGNLFADQLDFDREWMDDTRRYYANIVGKYGPQVQTLLKKASALDIANICPLHGPVWRKDLDKIIEKHQLWSTYTPESQSVVVLYGSIYGNTENAMEALAAQLSMLGVHNVKMLDASVTDVSYLIAEIFRASHLVLAAPTYNNNLYPPMAALLHDMKALNVQNRTVALVENGTWAAQSGRLMRAELETLKNMTILDPVLSLKSSATAAQSVDITALANAIVASM